MHVNLSAEPSGPNPLQQFLSGDVAAKKKAAQMNPAPPDVMGRPVGPKNPAELSRLEPSKVRDQLTTGKDAPKEIPVAPEGESTPLTMAGLYEAWGQSNSEYDLNTDGTVNMQDLVALLAQMSEAAGTPAPPGPKTQPPLGNEPPAAPAIGNETPEEAALPLTVDGLMEAWGQRGSEYDLDGNGTVNMQDLGQLLAQMQGAPPAGPNTGAGTPPIGTAVEETPNIFVSETPGLIGEDLTVDGLMEAWGQRGTNYDLNGDGIVGMQDLTELLSRMADNKTVPVNESKLGPGALADAAAPVGEVAPDVPGGNGEDLTVSGLMEAWGQRGGEYDLDGNGVVNMQDLIALLGQQESAPGGHAAPEAMRLAGGAMLGNSNSTDSLVKQLVQSFQNNGFDKSPPSNLDEIVQSLGLPKGQFQAVVDGVMNQYPGGFGLDMIG